MLFMVETLSNACGFRQGFNDFTKSNDENPQTDNYFTPLEKRQKSRILKQAIEIEWLKNELASIRNLSGITRKNKL